MNIILTSSEISTKNSIDSYSDNFKLCLLTTTKNLVSMRDDRFYHFDIYHNESTEITNISDTNGMSLTYISVANIGSALSKIAWKLKGIEHAELKKDIDSQDTITVVSACSYDVNNQIVKRLNNCLTSVESDLTCLNIFNMLKLPSMARLTKSLATSLSIDESNLANYCNLAFAIEKVFRGMPV